MKEWIFVLSVCACQFVFGQTECANCNIESLKQIRLSQEEPSIDAMSDYLICCNSKCSQNVEYSQASNYSLFVFIQKYPDIVIDAIESNIDSIDLSR